MHMMGHRLLRTPIGLRVGPLQKKSSLVPRPSEGGGEGRPGDEARIKTPLLLLAKCKPCSVMSTSYSREGAAVTVV